MNKVPYTPPTFNADNFNCPYCHAYAHQFWLGLDGFFLVQTGTANRADMPEVMKGVARSLCNRCRKECLWLDGVMIVPHSGRNAPQPNEDLNPEVVSDYEEAASIVGRSPRGAAALLRLALQKLCVQLGQPGDNINDDIGTLVELGMPVQAQQALDALRVIGNNAVHPGELDLKDDIDTASQLFVLINAIAEQLISQPKAIAEMYEKIPSGAKDAIGRRDGNAPASFEAETD